jgi:hypothetical protein
MTGVTILVYSSNQDASFNTGTVTYVYNSTDSSGGLFVYEGDSQITIDPSNSQTTNNLSLISIDIPGGILTWPFDAFNDNTNLREVLIHNGTLTTIPGGAFRGCTGLTTVYIPDTITTINSLAFPTTISTVIYHYYEPGGGTGGTSGYSNIAFGTSQGENISYIATNQNIINYFQQRYPDSTDASCFNKGTKILCLNKNFEEEYIVIENLRKGHMVKSYLHGYRKINNIGKGSFTNRPNIWHNCMYKMVKTEENSLIEDLIVTGGHSILVDNLGEYEEKNKQLLGDIKIDDKYLLLSALSDKFEKITDNEIYEYYHFTLENDGDIHKRYGVWANGILTETPSESQFLNHPYIDL